MIDLARRPYWRNSRGRDPINNGATSRHVPAARGADASATGEMHVLHESVYTARCTSAASRVLHIYTHVSFSLSISVAWMWDACARGCEPDDNDDDDSDANEAASSVALFMRKKLWVAW